MSDSSQIPCQSNGHNGPSILAGMNADVPKLNGKNYLNWKSMMSDLLSLRGLDAAIMEGNIDRAKNLQAKILLKGSIDETHLAEVRNYEMASEIWSHLSRMCIGANSNDVAMLVRKFYTFQYVAGDSMVTHLEKLSTMREQLIAVSQGPTDEVYIDRVLQTLPSEYNKLKENWDYLHPDQKNLKDLELRIRKIEEDMKISGAETKVENEAKVFIAKQAKQFGRMTISDKKKVTHCAKCGHKGHWARECKTKLENYKSKTDFKPREPQQEPKFKPKDVVFTTFENSEVDSVNRYTSYLVKDALKTQWIADSGASNHICNEQSWFKELKHYDTPRHITVGDSSESEVIGEGKIEIISKLEDYEIKATLEGVLYAPNMATNLFSIGQASKKGVETKFTQREVILTLNGERVGRGSKLNNNLYLMEMRALRADHSVALFSQAKRTLEEWHRTLGHANKERIIKCIENHELTVKATEKDQDIDCPDCPPGKGRHATHPSIGRRAQEVGERVFIDLAGPILESIGGYKYFMLAKDEHSTYTYVYCLRNKSDTPIAMKKLFNEFEVETNHSIKRIHSDQGSEFYKHPKIELILALEHAIHETAATYTPQQNGMIEREIQSIVGMARTMLIASQLPKSLWDEAIKTATYIRNRLPNKIVKTSPYETITNRKPRISHLCEFGRQVHVLIDGHYLTKFDPRTEEGFIVGFTQRMNTYRVYTPAKNRVIESCNVIFRSHKPTVNSSAKEDTNKMSSIDRFFADLLQNGGATDDDKPDSVYGDAPNCQTIEDEVESPAFSPITVHGEDSITEQTQEESVLPEVSLIFANICLNQDQAPEPQTFDEATSSNEKVEWQQAINEEFQAHEKNGTWTIVDKPKNKTLMTTKWVFKRKLNLDGSIERYKARLVARGFEQRPGQDFLETFAPVARYDSIRILIAIAAQLDLVYEQFDVTTAFLYGTLEEEVYIHPPSGMNLGPNKALRLIKGLYGLKQAPRIWSHKFKEEIEKIGFNMLKSDNCVFKHDKGIYLCIYVDDGLILARDRRDIQQVIKQLKQVFNIRVVQNTTFVGLEIEKIENGFLIHQESFALRILERFKMQDCSTVTAPLPTGHKLTELSEDDKSVDCPYREAIGSLLYLAANTRPDLLHAVTLLSKFSSDPKEKHWAALKRVMRYLKGSLSKGLCFQKQDNLRITVYTDSDHASDVQSRKSITGSIALISGGPVTFRSTQQGLVASSTTEAEYIAAAETLKDIIWITFFMKELDISHDKPTLRCDSMTAIKLIRNPEFHRRTKHIDIKYHFIRDYLAKDYFNLEFVPSEKQIADYLTKAIPRDQFDYLSKMSNIVDIKQWNKGGSLLKDPG